MKHIITAAAGAAAVLGIAACASSQAANAGGKSPGATPPAASPSAAPTTPLANAWKGQVGNTTVTAWCVVQKQTDKNGNPLNADLIYVDNTGQDSAEVFTVLLYYYDSAGRHVRTMSGDFTGHDSDLHLGSGDVSGMKMPPGLNTIGGIQVLNQSHDAKWELPPQVQTCVVAGIR